MTEAKPMTAGELAAVREILPRGQGASPALALDLLATIDALTAERDAANTRMELAEKQRAELLRSIDFRSGCNAEANAAIARAEAAEARVKRLEEALFALWVAAGIEASAEDLDGAPDQAEVGFANAGTSVRTLRKVIAAMNEGGSHD